MKTVVLAEKPDQKRKLEAAYRAGSFPELGDVTFVNARGHLYELDAPESYQTNWNRQNEDGSYKTPDEILEALPIYPEAFKYHKKSGTAKLITEIQQAIQSADQILIATDPDAEGASIAWKIIWRTKNFRNKVIKQLSYNAQTLDDFKQAFANPVPAERYQPMAYQAITREQSDWLVGMNASRLVTSLLRKKGYRANFPVGRVQTPTVAKIVAREREIQNYDPQQNLRVTLLDQTHNVTFKGIDGVGEFRPSNGGQPAAQAFYNQIAAGQSVITDVVTTRQRQNAPALFKFSKLQAEASRRFKWSPKKTSDIYQKLYEQGWVSYPRTDEQHIAPSEFDYLKANVLEYLALANMHDMPIAYLEPRAKYVTTKALDHSANIPSSQIPTTEELATWSEEKQQLYRLILERTLLMFAPDMVYDETMVIVTNSGYQFKAIGKVISDSGWTSFAMVDKQSQDLPIYKTGAVLQLVPQMNSIAAPKRYTETDMTDHVMDAMGLGRPSTQAGIIEKIEETYINKTGKRGELSPKPEAFVLVDFLGKTMLTSPDMTANWEIYLDKIGAGDQNAKPETFLQTLQQFLEQLRHNLPQRLAQDAVISPIKPDDVEAAHRPFTDASEQIETPYGVYHVQLREGKNKSGKSYLLATLLNQQEQEMAKIWGTQYGKKLTVKQLKTLLSQGIVKNLTFKKKSGEGTYKASLVLNENFDVKLSFDDKNNVSLKKRK
ncbi:hypothetical protein K1728_06550 [Weissella confusa]|uniref:type IA DNA topoisomerase n=1 Tax=Weissella confusa TaxID=1583 RepID=UPI001C6FB33A|nr:type IA DNA topoisomerase [Weissella confusa]QYU56851.1 hypothetical protein K1728_06550 [Weissella confusa]